MVLDLLQAVMSNAAMWETVRMAVWLVRLTVEACVQAGDVPSLCEQSLIDQVQMEVRTLVALMDAQR